MQFSCCFPSGPHILLIVSVFRGPRNNVLRFLRSHRRKRPDEQFCDTISERDERDSRRYFAFTSDGGDGIARMQSGPSRFSSYLRD